MRFVASLFAAGIVGVAALADVAAASQLTYSPVNPTFGGSPLNGSYLLAVAQSQGKGFAAKNVTPDLSGLNSAIASLSSALAGVGAQSVNPNMSPVIVVSPGSTIPTNP
ncbi:MAG TPA: curli assembly protein CsgF [Stellaceae bacterium]|nr:curli assembly protein CsgF [Stellaceae bacterium]